jgi:hypothetical protein
MKVLPTIEDKLRVSRLASLDFHGASAVAEESEVSSGWATFSG